MNIFRTTLIAALVLLAATVFAQGTYYNGISTSSSTFVTDLHNLIYPHTAVSYDQFDETNVANFASWDAGGGQRSVRCVYSGEVYTYTPPFAWGTYSREHTWCHSWMPSYPSESGKEYCDQHHLFPTNQNNANGRRSNHPLGTVVTASFTYLECKLGTDQNGNTVFQPRNSHKGDAARALFYMAVCYNGVSSMNWTFDYLNNTTLPNLANPEPPINLDTLLAWHSQDPPDDWERARNEYVYSIQNNRNPFVDHPEYVNYIDFKTLTYKAGGSITEPANYPTNLAVGSATLSALTVSWTDADAGSLIPDGYLLLANTTGTFSAPTDGSTVSDDTNLGDGSAAVNIAYSAGNSTTFSGLAEGTTYYFRMYSYAGSGSSIDYKTSGTPPSAEGSTLSPTGGTFPYTQNFGFITGAGTDFPASGDGSEFINQSSVTRTFTTGTTGGVQKSTSPTGIILLKSGSNTPRVVLKQNFSGRVLNGSENLVLVLDKTTANTRINRLKVEYGLDTTTYTEFLNTSVYRTDESPTGQTKTIPIMANLAASTALNNKSAVYFRFSSEDVSGSGSRPGILIDNIAIEGGALPVELTTLSAHAGIRGIELRWRTATETDNYGFEIQRAAGETWTALAFISGAGTSATPHDYAWTDRTPVPGTSRYRLKQIDNGGAISFSGIVSATLEQPKKPELFQNNPNPFNPRTSITFRIPESAPVHVAIYDMLGRECAVLARETFEAGLHSLQFDASTLPSGVYMYVLRSNGFTAARKMLVVK